MPGQNRGEEAEIREPETTTRTPEPEVEVQRIAIDNEMRVVIVGAGCFGRVALDVLLSGGYGDRTLGFYDDAHAVLPGRIRGYPVLGDVEMLKSMLSVDPAHVVVAITHNEARLRIANTLRRLGGGVGARAVLGANASIGRKAEVGAEAEVEAARHVAREGG